MATVGDLAVYVTDSDGGTRWLLPGDEVPEWAVGQLGDHCFATPTESDDPRADEAPRPRRGRPPKVHPVE